MQPLVSADFLGAAMALVERTVRNSQDSLFLQGACADQNPVCNTSDFADVERYGLMLGGEIVKRVGQLSAPDYASPTQDVALVALPGEPFAELGLTIKERSVAPHTIVVGYANDWIGYLVTP
ncbi:hypothetical protein KFU94_57050 [Chloroflexi bacterium TSY]|nr:hypothetical protein [Chloroflexi bacterium TSY]